MNTNTSVNNQSTATGQGHYYITGSVVSRDGTTIGYRQLGHGPAVVLVQGAMGSAHNFMQLAGMLADAFTVYVPDRRGRGLSSLAYSKDYSIQKDVEDLDALLAKTGAHSVTHEHGDEKRGQERQWRVLADEEACSGTPV